MIFIAGAFILHTYIHCVHAGAYKSEQHSPTNVSFQVTAADEKLAMALLSWVYEAATTTAATSRVHCRAFLAALVMVLLLAEANCCPYDLIPCHNQLHSNITK